MSDWVCILRLDLPEPEVAALTRELRDRYPGHLRSTTVAGWLWDDMSKPPEPRTVRVLVPLYDGPRGHLRRPR